jgi:hypothetical protein
MPKISGAALAAILCASAAAAQDAVPSPANDPIVATPVPAASVPAAPTTMLPANSEITLSLNEELTSRRHRQGQTFDLSVAGKVMLGNYVVIPAGTRAVGEVTWVTGRGMFGKSGKMNIAIRYIDLNGRHIPVEGTFRQEGEGNTVATLAGVAVVPIAGLFITGHSAVIPQGRQLVVRLRDDLPVILPDVATATPAPQPAAQQQ